LMDRLFELVLTGQAAAALETLARIYEGGGELRQVVRGLMERCRDKLVAAVERQDGALRARLSSALDALLHLDGEVRRHAEPRFLVEATLVRIAVEGAPAPPAEIVEAGLAPPAISSPLGGEVPAQRAEGPPSKTEPPASPSLPSAPSGEEAGLVDGWQRVLAQLPPKVKGLFREARPEREGSKLVLWFRYGFHHQNAQEHVSDVAPLVKAWLGEDVGLEFRLAEATESAPVQRPPAPEEHPFVQAAVRKLEGKVTRVREISR
jgi:hypothetical protein